MTGMICNAVHCAEGLKGGESGGEAGAALSSLPGCMQTRVVGMA